MMIAQERDTGETSELIGLERQTAKKLGLNISHGRDFPTPAEQALTQGGHLLLSGIAGAAYAATTDEDTPMVTSGVLFGLAFYGVAHWLTGPLLGVKKPEWQADRGTIGMHAANHVAFGLAAAAGAKIASGFSEKTA